MKELVVISGKGGTGKTSILGSFAVLAGNAVLADCDVDAADLFLILEPRILDRGEFSGSSRALIHTDRCTGCGECERLCRFDAIHRIGTPGSSAGIEFRVDPVACEGCGVCSWFCPENAIDLVPAVNGEWFVSDTRCGPMVHARLGIAEEASGKLVSLVREKARCIAEDRSLSTVLIDGSPGIGCPVIASMTGADLALVITEPTLSGLHDLRRVADLTKHFGIETMVCINKWDLNGDISLEIERQCHQRGLSVAGRVRYDRAVTEAQILRMTVIEFTEHGAAEDIGHIWNAVQKRLSSLYCPAEHP